MAVDIPLLVANALDCDGDTFICEDEGGAFNNGAFTLCMCTEVAGSCPGYRTGE